MPDIEKAQIFEKMCTAALKEKFSRLSGKYDPDLILKIWAKDKQHKGLRMYFGKLEWWQDKTIGQVLDRLDDYFNCLENVIRENSHESKKKPNKFKRPPKISSR
jgi:hypothetical protein